MAADQGGGEALNSAHAYCRLLLFTNGVGTSSGASLIGAQRARGERETYLSEEVILSSDAMFPFSIAAGAIRGS